MAGGFLLVEIIMNKPSTQESFASVFFFSSVIDWVSEVLVISFIYNGSKGLHSSNFVG